VACSPGGATPLPRGAARGFPHFSILRCGPAVPARPGSAGRSDIAVVAPRPTIMPDDHRPAMPQVTAVDDQFGTHRQVRATMRRHPAITELSPSLSRICTGKRAAVTPVTVVTIRLRCRRVGAGRVSDQRDSLLTSVRSSEDHRRMSTSCWDRTSDFFVGVNADQLANPSDRHGYRELRAPHDREDGSSRVAT
jgi:hypothetical protein